MLSLSVSEVIEVALREDIGSGDLSSAVLPRDMLGEARLYAKESGVVCGLSVMRDVFVRLDPELIFEACCAEGEAVTQGSLVARVKGRMAGILQAERTALNFLQHLSGIATQTARMVEAAAAGVAKGASVRVVDTRKTLPGLRALQKYAVRTGGGYNHRLGLYDAVMLKDNHLAAAGGMAPAMARARETAGHMVKIEVECETLEQVREAVACAADVIMLDNMSVEEMRGAVTYIAGRALVEASGDIGLSTIAQVAATGVDIISLGCLTHSVRAMDFSLVVDTLAAGGAKPSLQAVLEKQAQERKEESDGGGNG